MKKYRFCFSSVLDYIDILNITRGVLNGSGTWHLAPGTHISLLFQVLMQHDLNSTQCPLPPRSIPLTLLVLRNRRLYKGRMSIRAWSLLIVALFGLSFITTKAMSNFQPPNKNINNFRASCDGGASTHSCDPGLVVDSSKNCAGMICLASEFGNSATTCCAERMACTTGANLGSFRCDTGLALYTSKKCSGVTCQASDFGDDSSACCDTTDNTGTFRKVSDGLPGFQSTGCGNDDGLQEACMDPNLAVAGVRCCGGEASSQCPSNGAFGGSNQDCKRFTYAKAVELCAAAGARLCTVAELQAGDAGGTGCLYDYMPVWTSNECSEKMTCTEGNIEGLECHTGLDVDASQKCNGTACSANDFGDSCTTCCHRRETCADGVKRAHQSGVNVHTDYCSGTDSDGNSYSIDFTKKCSRTVCEQDDFVSSTSSPCCAQNVVPICGLFPCPLGKFGRQNLCMLCPAGFIGNPDTQIQQGQSSSNPVMSISCKPPWHYTNTETLEPHACYQDEAGKRDCKECSAGWGLSNKYVKTLNKCYNFVKEEGDALDVNYCGHPSCGNTTKIQACIACQRNQFSNNSRCWDCPGGYQAEAQSTSCIPCSYGKYRVGDMPYCSSCPLGTSYVSSTTCELCAPYKYRDNQNYLLSAECKTCPNGFEFTQRDAGCARCAPGKYNADYTRTCTNCPAGFFGVQGEIPRQRCNACATGRFSDTHGAISETACKDCNKGHFSNETGIKLCDKCPVGYYQDEKGGNECLGCEAGTYGNEIGASSASHCAYCPSGYFQSKSSQISCTSCSPGKQGSGTKKTSEETARCTHTQHTVIHRLYGYG